MLDVSFLASFISLAMMEELAILLAQCSVVKLFYFEGEPIFSNQFSFVANLIATFFGDFTLKI